MTRRKIAVPALIVAGAIAVAYADGLNNIREFLSGYQEVPAVSTSGRAVFHASLDEVSQQISYELSYTDLEGSITQSHIHFGQAGVNGGISVFLCTNLGNGPAGTQLCPQSPATISGTITPNDVIGPGTQGITAGQFGELLQAMRADRTYVNVHSTMWPGGEVRSQIMPNRRGQ